MCYVSIVLSKNGKVVPSFKIDKSVWTNLKKDELADNDSQQVKNDPQIVLQIYYPHIFWKLSKIN